MSILNFIGLLITMFNAVAMYAMVDGLLAYLLLDPNYFADYKTFIVDMNDMLFYCQFVAVASNLLFGFMHDFIGRRFTILIGFTISCFAFGFTPYTSPNVYPDLLLIRY